MAGIVGGLQLQPAIECVHCPAGKEMSNVQCAHDDIDPLGISRTNRSLHSIQWRGDRSDGRSSRSPRRRFHLRFFAYRKCSRQLRCGVDHLAIRQAIRRRFRRDGENVDADFLIFQKVFGVFQLHCILVHKRKRGISCDKAMRVDHAVHIAGIVGGRLRHMAILAIQRLRRIVKGSRT